MQCPLSTSVSLVFILTLRLSAGAKTSTQKGTLHVTLIATTGVRGVYMCVFISLLMLCAQVHRICAIASSGEGPPHYSDSERTEHVRLGMYHVG